MLRNLALSSKLYLSFAIILSLLVILGLIVYANLGSISNNSSKSIVFANQDRFVVEKENDHIRWVNGLERLFIDNLTKAEIEIDDSKCGLGQFLGSELARDLAVSIPGLAEQLERIKEPHRKLHETAQRINGVWKQRHSGLRHLLKDIQKAHHIWALTLSTAIVKGDGNVAIEENPELCGFGRYVKSKEFNDIADKFPPLREAANRLAEPHRRLHESAARIKAHLNAGQQAAAQNLFDTETIRALEIIQQVLDDTISMESDIEARQAEAEVIYRDETRSHLVETQEKLKSIGAIMHEAGERAQNELQSNVVFAQAALVIVAFSAIGLGIIISLVLTRAISLPIRKVIESLASGSQQVTEASGQVSESSQQMAAGASEQASSLEEISSSIEEVSSMIRQSADNARQTDQLARAAVASATDGSEAMRNMNSAIERIKTSSDETAKIVKTIDEIAFQTNLLALNAAVEAARAGDAGKGFAVVAEEVRSLAQRSAEAAKTTSALIIDSQRNADDGVAAARSVTSTLTDIISSVEKVKELIAEVALASNEQSQGVDQINVAISELDKVTQTNAASAEESASASEELSAQARELGDMVNVLRKIVDGASHSTAPVRQLNHMNGNKPERKISSLHPAKKAIHRFESITLKPEQVIPLSSEDTYGF